MDTDDCVIDHNCLFSFDLCHHPTSIHLPPHVCSFLPLTFATFSIHQTVCQNKQKWKATEFFGLTRSHQCHAMVLDVCVYVYHYPNIWSISWQSTGICAFWIGVFFEIVSMSLSLVHILLFFIFDAQTYLWRQAVADGWIDSIGVCCRGHKAVRVSWEAVSPRGQAVSGASILGSSWCAEPTLVHRGGRQRLWSVDCTGLLRSCCNLNNLL